MIVPYEYVSGGPRDGDLVKSVPAQVGTRIMLRDGYYQVEFHGAVYVAVWYGFGGNVASDRGPDGADDSEAPKR